MADLPTAPPPASAGTEPAPPDGAWRIGRWTFEASRHLLRGPGGERRLEPKAAAVLAALARRPGRVHGREELLAAAWPGLYVTDDVLTNAVYELRRALGDDARRPRYIETIPRRGYRLAAEVAAADGRRRGTRRRRAWWVAATAAAGLALAVVGWQRPGTTPAPAVPAPDGEGRANAARRAAEGWRALDRALPGAALAAMEAAGAAIAADPGSADPWALGAAAWAEQVSDGSAGPAEGRAAARPYLDRALELDPDHPRALATRALLRWLAAWDWAGAEADLDRAVAAHPGVAEPRALRSQLWLFSGRVDRAREEAETAVRLAPGSVRVRLTAGLVAAVAGDEDAASGHYRAALRRAPGHPHARRQLAKLAAPAPGREALSPELTAEEVEALAAKRTVGPGVVAVLYARAGAGERALDWLERAVAAHDATVLFFRFDPRWDPWRDHPRYRAAMRPLRHPAPAAS